MGSLPAGGVTDVDLGDRTSEETAVSLTRAGLASLFAYMDEALVCCDHDGTIRFAGGSFTDLFGYDADSLVGRCVLDFVDPADHARLADNLARWVGRSGAPRGTIVTVRAADGTWMPVRYDTVIRDDLGPLGPIAITLVPAQVASAEERERRSRLLGIDRLVRLASTFLQVPHDEFDRGIDAAVQELAGLEQVTRASVWRSDGHRVVLRGSWTSAANAPTIDLAPRARIDDLPSLRRLALGEEVGLAPISGNSPASGLERDLYEAAGTLSSLGVPMMSGGCFIGFVLLESTIGDITVSASHGVTARAAAAILAEAFVRHEAEVQLADQARTDRVTGLANRWAFDEAIAAAQADVAAGTSRGLALVLLDLDRFKLVNDSLGHAAGDLLLADVASRFSAAADEGTTVARLGGDELLALLHDEPDVESAGRRAAGLLAAFATPFDVGGEALVLTASAGVAHTVDPTTPPGELMRRADVAMYRAKARGGAAVELDDPSQPSGESSVLRREAELRRAVEEGELVTFVQGEWDLLTGDLLGAEALVRWQHPEEGLLVAGRRDPAGRGLRADRRGRAHGPGRRLSHGGALAAPPSARGSWCGSTSRPTSSAAATSRNRSSMPWSTPASPPTRCAWSSPRARCSSTRRARPRCSSSCARSASASRWTTSAPATRRSSS